MTNQVNQAFAKWWHSSKYMQVVFSDNRTKRVALDGYEAATKASESEINSLKERVKELEADLELLKPHPKCDMGCMLSCNTEGNAIRELQADNNWLREAIEISLSCVDEEINPNNYNGEILTNFIHDYGRMIDILQNALSSTPAQSLAEHDNEVIERCAQLSDACAYMSPNFNALSEEIRSLKG